MAVVLRESTHAHDAVQAAAGLVAVAVAELAVAQRQVAVALDALLVDQDVAGAVHRLQGVVALLALRREHRVLVLVPVAAQFPQRLVDHLRTLDLLVAVVLVDLAHVLLDALPDRPALRVPEHHAGRVIVDVEQVELAAQLAVVALLGFLQHRQVLREFFLRRPGRAVDALQHLVAVVAAPVGAGHLHQLEELQLARAGHVRAAAQVLEGALAVQRDVLAFGDAADDLGLVGLAHVLEVLDSLVARQHAARHRLVLGRELRHLLLDGGQVFRRERALVGEVVEEAVLDHRADRDLGVGEQFLDGVGQQVGRGVADQVEAVGVLGRDDGQRLVALDQVARVDQLRVARLAHAASERGLGQARADGGGDIGHGDRLRELAFGTVGQLDGDHRRSPCRKQKSAAPGRAFECGNGKVAARQCATAGRASRIAVNVTVVRGVITRRAFLILEAGVDPGTDRHPPILTEVSELRARLTGSSAGPGRRPATRGSAGCPAACR